MAAETYPDLTRAVVVCVTVILNVYVKADGFDNMSHGDTLFHHNHGDTHMPYDCSGHCEYGCCQSQCCAGGHQDQDSLSSSGDTIKIVAVLGGILVVLILIALCILRYRCLVKIRERSARHYTSASRRNAAMSRSSIFAMSVPPQSLERLMSRLTNIQHSQNESLTAGGQLVVPPPYSLNDPFTSPSYDGESSDQIQFGEPPPAYADIVKNAVMVVEEEASTQEELPENPSQEESENPTSTELGR